MYVLFCLMKLLLIMLVFRNNFLVKCFVIFEFYNIVSDNTFFTLCEFADFTFF